MKLRVKLTRAVNYKVFGVKANTVQVIELEEYVAHVVPSEMRASWEIEALKAQAVCARSYAVYKAVKRAASAYDVNDTTNYQAFKMDAELGDAAAAVEATAGQVLVYKDGVAYAAYAASNGGECLSAKSVWGLNLPYLIAQPDPWDEAAGHAKNGHGVGMSQRGAEYAAENGKTYQDILAFYFPGAHLGSLSSLKIKVNPADTETDTPSTPTPDEPDSPPQGAAPDKPATPPVALPELGAAAVGMTGRIVVNSAGLNVRVAPNGKLAAYKLANEDTVTILEFASKPAHDWYRVQDEQGHSGGWVRSDYVAFDKNI